MKQKLFIMKKTFLLILIIISVAAIHSCKKKYIPGGPGNPPTGNTPKDVYVAGSMDGIGGYWKNETFIPGTGTGGGRIAVSGSDIYLTGGADYYWKNGTKIPMEPPFAFQPVNT